MNLMKQLLLKNGKVITIRKARKTDARAILKYLNIIGGESDFLAFGRNEFDGSIVKIKTQILQYQKAVNCLYLIACDAKGVMGVLRFTGGKGSRMRHTGGFGVSVAKKYWGMGIGKELTKTLIEWARATGIVRKINLRVREDNTKAITLYQKLGFSKEGSVTRDLLVQNKFYTNLMMGISIG